MIQCVQCLVLLVTMTFTAASWLPRGMAINVLVGLDTLFNTASQYNAMEMQARQYLNVSTGHYLVLQPDCNLIPYNHSQLLMSTNTSCDQILASSRFSTRDNYTAIDTITLSFANSTNTTSLDLTPSYLDSSGNDEERLGTNLWTYILGGGMPSLLYPYLILRANGTCDFYDSVGNQLFDQNGGSGGPFLKPYTVPVGLAAPNSSGNLSLGPNMAYPFLPQLAWEPLYPLDGSPYLPAGYFLSITSALRTVVQNFALMLGSNCNLQCKEILSNGSEIVLRESGTSNSSSKIQYCDQVMLRQDGSLVIRNYNESGFIVYNNVTVAGNASVSWVLRLSPTDGSLSISDIEDSTNVLWTNVDLNQTNRTNRTTTWVVVGAIGGVSVLAMAGLALLYFHARTNILDPAEKAFRRRLKESGGKSQTRYSQDKIKQATNNFGNKIGFGGFGDMFYGNPESLSQPL